MSNPNMNNTSNSPYPLWTGPELPPADALPLLPQAGVRHIRIHTAEAPMTLLIGPAVMKHKGVLYTSWAQAPDGIPENGPEEFTRGRRSRDDGATWGEAEILAPAHDQGRNHSHGSFLSHKGVLWFFAPTYIPDKHSFFGDLKTEAFVLDEPTDRWISKGMVALDLYPMDTPKRMSKGNWIMGGLNGAARAALAISDGDDFTKWRTISLPQVPGGAFGETTVVVAGDRMLAIARSNRHVPDRALVYESFDQGENWTTERVSNYPMTPAKPNAGILSDGRLYLVSNMGPNRNIPVFAYGDPGSLSLNRAFRLRADVPAQPRFSGPNHAPEWAYYYTHEADGSLYIAYHHDKEDAELTVVSLSGLA